MLNEEALFHSNLGKKINKGYTSSHPFVLSHIASYHCWLKVLNYLILGVHINHLWDKLLTMKSPNINKRFYLTAGAGTVTEIFLCECFLDSGNCDVIKILLLTFHLNDPKVLGLAILSDHQGWDGYKTVLSLSSYHWHVSHVLHSYLVTGGHVTRHVTRGCHVFMKSRARAGQLPAVGGVVLHSSEMQMVRNKCIEMGDKR